MVFGQHMKYLAMPLNASQDDAESEPELVVVSLRIIILIVKISHQLIQTIKKIEVHQSILIFIKL